MFQADLFGSGLPSASPVSFVFKPKELASVPHDIEDMPEATETEKIAKAKAVLAWLMVNYETAFSFSGGKDSSCVLGLAMAAAAEIHSAGGRVKKFVVMTADTLVENPNVHAVTHGELSALRIWIKRHQLPGSVHIARPHLAAQFAVNIIGGRSLPSTAETKRDCTTDWKSQPLSRLRKKLLGANDIAGGRYVVSVTGVRFAESAARASNMTIRGESPVKIVQTNEDGNVAIAPIANWSWDDVFTYLGLANAGEERTYSDFGEVIRVYREAMGECVITGADDDLASSKPCSARTGCWTCLMVKNDRSMDTMLAEPGNDYMRPLARFRTFLSNTFYDLSRRTWVGRTIDADGYIKFAPDGYSPAMLQDLLRYALTIQAEEIEAAQALGIRPRFSIIGVQALLAIDAMWSLQGFAAPFTALNIYRDVLRGARYPIPDVPEYPKTAIPAPRFIKVGADWDQDSGWLYTGLRDPLLEEFGGAGCMGTREITTKGRKQVVMDANTDNMFTVDLEGAELFLEFELDRVVDEWHSPAGRRIVMEGHHVAGAGYRFYIQYGVISVAKTQLARVDEILRRTAYRERLGLAGYQYDHDRALAMSVATKPPRAALESTGPSCSNADRALSLPRRPHGEHVPTWQTDDEPRTPAGRVSGQPVLC